MATKEKQFVEINSTMTINVTSGLQANDLTRKDSDIPNRLKVKPMWSSCLIKMGVHTYPANIAEWNTVKKLQEDRILSIIGFTDDPGTEDATELTREKAKLDLNEKKIKELNLADVAGV